MENNKNIEYSIVIPVYNSERTLNELTERLISIFHSITDNFEIIYVDDCSVDNSLDRLKEIRTVDKRIRIIHLIKNYGQHNAIFCGFHYVEGKYVVIMDDDLQTPPEEIPKLIQKLSEGYMGVYASYSIKKHSRVENFFSSIMQGFIHVILNIPSDIVISSFAIFKREVIDNVKAIKSAYIFLPALINKNIPVHCIANIEVQHDERKYGRSNYSLSKYLNLSLNLLINYSSLPLTLVGIFGVCISVGSFLFGILIIIRKIQDPAYGIMGWNSLMVTLTFLGGTILMSLAIVGEYLRRILGEISYEQPYIIGEMEL